MRKTIMAALGAAMLTTAIPGGAAMASEAVALPNIERAYPGESYSQYRRHGGYHHRRHGYYRRGGGGGAAAAGIIGGLAAGAIIGGAIANSGAQAQPLPRTQDPDFIAYCSRKYRSFDPVDGTFLATDGNRYPCQ